MPYSYWRLKEARGFAPLPSAKEFNHLAAAEKQKILAGALGELRALGIHYNFAPVIDVDYKTANWIVVAVSVLLGLGFVAVMPQQARRTARSDAEELGILFCLMTVASPLARQYYFMWLFFPLTVLMHRAAFDARAKVRLGTWLALGAAGILMLLSLPPFPNAIQAWGNNLMATAVLAGTLAWHLRHPPVAAGSDAAAKLELKAS